MKKYDPSSAFSDSASSAYGVRITHYRLITQAAPGLVGLLILLQSGLTPETIRPLGGDPSWQKLVGVGVPVLLLSLPAGFVLSGVSYFMLGWIVFPLRHAMWRTKFFAPLVWILRLSVGNPEILMDEPLPKAQAWTRYINDVGFILRKHGFRGPREDAPDKVVAVAIFARSFALLALCFGSLRCMDFFGEWSWSESWIEAIATCLSFLTFLVFASVFELYRDYTLAVAADQYQEYYEFEDSNSGEPRAIQHAKERATERSR